MAPFNPWPPAQQLDWLLSAIGPRLTGEKHFWICLRADADCIGGVLWAAPAGESQRAAAPQTHELTTALAVAWRRPCISACRPAPSRNLAASAEQLSDANRDLQPPQGKFQSGRARKTITTSISELAAGSAPTK